MIDSARLRTSMGAVVPGAAVSFGPGPGSVLVIALACYKNVAVRVSDFNFELPERLIAQEARPRGESRLLAVDRAAGTWRELAFRDLPNLFDPGDLLVVNDTRVFPARLLGRRDPSGGAVECLLLRRLEDGAGAELWDALVHPGQKLKPGTWFVIEDDARAPGVRIRGE